MRRVTYFTGRTASDTTHRAATLTATSADDFYTIFKKALDLEFYPSIEVAAEALPSRKGELPDSYILISLNRYDTVYVNGDPMFISGAFDVITACKPVTALEGITRRIRNALVSRNFRETGNEGNMETDDTARSVYRQEFLFIKGYNDE